MSKPENSGSGNGTPTSTEELTQEQQILLAHASKVQGFVEQGFTEMGDNAFGRIKDDVLTIKVHLSAPTWDSKPREKDGVIQPSKSDMVASTRGNIIVRPQDGLRLSVNAYFPKGVNLGS